MLRKALLAAAVSGIAVTTALAQATAPTTPPASSAPSVTQPAPSTSRAPTAAAPSTADKPMFITKQSADQHLASKFKGTDVVGPAEEKIGDVSDVLFDEKGTVLAYIVGVGGFLGIGAKDVAIAPASFQKVADGSSYKLRLSMTKDELKQAAAFEPYTPPRPAASATPRPTTSPMAPAPAPAPTPRKE